MAVRGSRDPVYYYVGRQWYKGDEPPFYDAERSPATKILKDHYEAIRAEIEAHYAARAEDWKPNYTPYAYREEGWKTINLFSYFLEYPEQTAKFPVTTRVVQSIPGMCLAQIAVLAPRTRIKAHFGDCDALVRHHMGIRVPGRYPELGMRVGRRECGWEEGEVFAIQIAHRHFAWNYTDHHRIVLVVDTIRPQYADRRYEIAGRALSAIALKHVATRHPLTRRLPERWVRRLHPVVGRAFQARLWAQRNLRGIGAGVSAPREAAPAG